MIPLNIFEVFSNILYYDEPHKYYVGDKQLVSATTFIGKFKPKFDTPTIGAAYAEKHERDYENVVDEWDYKRDRGTTKGSMFHKYAENRLMNKIFPYDGSAVLKDFGHDILKAPLEILFGFFDKYYNDSRGNLVPVKSELIVGNGDLGICGTVDQLYYNKKAGEFQIWDWKTNKKMESKSKYSNKFLHPISHLDVCEINTYSLQLSLYRYLIHQMTDLKIGDCYIVWFFEKNETYKIFKCFDLTDEIEDMIKYATQHQWI